MNVNWKSLFPLVTQASLGKSFMNIWLENMIFEGWDFIKSCH